METKVFGSIVVTWMTWEPVRTEPSDIGSANGPRETGSDAIEAGNRSKGCMVSFVDGGGIDGHLGGLRQRSCC